MSTKIFVGSLDYSIDDEGLRKAFLVFGEIVEAKVIIDRHMNRSRGFGFVSFATPEGAAAALEKGNGMEIMERAVTVKEAKERDPNAEPRSNNYQDNRPFNRGYQQNRRYNNYNNGGNDGYNNNYNNENYQGGGFRRRNQGGYDGQQQGGQYGQQQRYGQQYQGDSYNNNTEH
ncbi:hypothetical protein J3B02_004973 [Coemansia erecta]|uniref:RRM domain-containing protein n=1 Tax=Coemansia asiatica TaxID=1052880 RepID=A0A9W7XJI3_9FUNG|nr:hypothetical protein LPJ64_003776 [Coemansia asiatica]KAJ2844405.1 hypothetical protein J3B02_004973 [Coemansia erecta]KAJ2875648.1 hypothetical protein FB639_003974 [Coemansia asiatica]